MIYRPRLRWANQPMILGSDGGKHRQRGLVGSPVSAAHDILFWNGQRLIGPSGLRVVISAVRETASTAGLFLLAANARSRYDGATCRLKAGDCRAACAAGPEIVVEHGSRSIDVGENDIG